MRMEWRQWLCIILLSFLWGGSFFSTKVALDVFHPVFIAWMRLVFAATALGLCVVFLPVRVPRSLLVWLQLLLLGVVNNAVPFMLISWGQVHISASLASILNATTPLFVIIIAHFFLSDEKMTIMKAFGVCAGFVGVVVMIGFDVLSQLTWLHLAQLAILGGTVSYATATVYARRFATLSPIVLAFAQTALAACAVGLVYMVLDVQWSHSTPTVQAWVALVSLGVVSTACAYILYFYVLKTAGATNVLLVTFLVPFSATALGIVALNELLTLQQIIGAFAIAVGLSLVDGRFWRYLLFNNQTGTDT